MNTRLVDHKEVEVHGFARFNKQPHLLVDVPNGNFTITCRTSNGKKITFAFQAYEENGAPACVDVCHHTSPKAVMNGDHRCPLQEVLCFSAGYNAFVSKLDDQKPVTLTTIMLEPRPVVR
jgi:Fe-S-cluster-containing dehydrogenase component